MERLICRPLGAVHKHWYTVHTLQGSLSEPHNRSLLHLPLITNMLGTFNACNFKRNKSLPAVVEKETPEDSKTLLSLCRTRWVERHEAHGVFFALLPSILRALEAMWNKRLFADQFGEIAWNWDTDSKSKANNLLHAVSNFEVIITQIATVKCLSILKPLSIKLQKRDIDVYEAYNHIKDLKGELQDIRGGIDKYCSDCYGMANTTARKANRHRAIYATRCQLVGNSTEASRNTEGLPTKQRSQFLC